jgi:metallo-beta-lactamase family protein
VAQGFRGRIFCTPGTQDLCSLVLTDSARIHEEDARDANRHGYTKHQPALPLYTVEDAARALTLLTPVGYERSVPVAPEIEAEFINTGHLLGSACAKVRLPDRTVLFGGDLGRYGRPVLPDPTPVDGADVLLVEATYGNRRHLPDDDGARLAAVVSETAARGGRLIIPAFAIGRVGEVIYWLKRLEDAGRIPRLPVFVDSPMAGRALEFYANRVDELDPDMRGDGLDKRKVAAFYTSRMTTIASPQESKELVASRSTAIVIAASGMATGGRVLHHLEAVLPDAKNTVLFVGYQAAGTRGRSLVDGSRTLRLKGRDIAVAARVELLDSMSAHADATEIMKWLGGFTRPPQTTYIVHGEPTALDALGARIRTERHWAVHIPRHGERVEL